MAGRRSVEIDSSAWLALLVLSLVGAGVGIFYVAPMGFQFAGEIGIVLTAIAGCVAWFSLEYFWAARLAEQERGPKPRPLTGRAREIALAPSFEVYDPRAPGGERHPAPTEPPTDELDG
jgi:predicted aspartyl protease